MSGGGAFGHITVLGSTAALIAWVEWLIAAARESMGGPSISTDGGCRHTQVTRPYRNRTGAK